MSRRKKPNRTVQEYIEAAKRLAKFAPSLQKYKRRKTLTKYEKSAIARKEKILRYVDHLVPLTKQQARKMKDQLFAPGIRAIQLRDTSPGARIEKINKDMIVTSNGRTWLYWKLEKLDTQNWKRKRKTVFGEAAQTYFQESIEAFPIEKIERLVKHAFKKIPKKKQIHLWTKSGRVAKGFTGINAFMDWLLSEHVRAYRNTDEWVNGIAILVYENQ